MKSIRIDENAHAIIQKAKEAMKQEGIESPSVSDVLRWMWQKIQSSSP